MKLLKAPLLLVMTLIFITSASTFASRTFTPVLDTTNLSGYVEITPPLGNHSYTRQFFDTIGINIPYQAAILSNDYHNRVYGKSEFTMYLKESVFVLDSLYVDETKVKSNFNDFKQKLLSLRDSCGSFTLRRASDLCNDPILCQTFIVTFDNYVNATYVINLMNNSFNYCNLWFGFPAIPQSVNEIGFSSSTYLLYPNPVKDKFTLQFTSEQKTNQFYEVLDLTGKVMQSGELKLEANQTMQVNVDNLTKGTYLLKIDNSITKFIKD